MTALNTFTSRQLKRKMEKNGDPNFFEANPDIQKGQQFVNSMIKGNQDYIVPDFDLKERDRVMSELTTLNFNSRKSYHLAGCKCNECKRYDRILRMRQKIGK